MWSWSLALNSSAALANVLAVAGATPRAVSGGVSYGKRSAQTTAEDVYVERSLRPGRAPQDLDGPEQEAELKDPEAHPSGVPASVIAQVLKAAGAEPQPVVKGDISYLGKREAQEASVEADEPVVAQIPLAAVKISPHSSNGNIVQHFDGNSAYQSSVHVSRFGRARRSTEDNFIPFHVYDDRRVKTLKVEQNDFLALKPKHTETREKRNNQQETNTKNHA